jgi:uncharacterized membrane protein
MYSKHRLEMLSDAVFAIAMTLLILDLKAPTDVAPGQLVSTLMHEKSSYLSLVLTFMLSASMWAFQPRLFEVTESTACEKDYTDAGWTLADSAGSK